MALLNPSASFLPPGTGGSGLVPLPPLPERGSLDFSVAAMNPLTSDNFGLLIAYLLPGFVALCGMRPFLPIVNEWLGNTGTAAPTVGGFLYVTLASTAAGLIVSTVRWAVIDQLYHRTGIPAPAWDFGKLPSALDAFDSHVQDHYRYYQFAANMLVAIAFTSGAVLVVQHRWPGEGGWPDGAVAFVMFILVLGSRDNLRKYYSRKAALLTPAQKRPKSARHLSR